MIFERKYNIVGCAAIIVLLKCCGIAFYFNQKQDDASNYSELRTSSEQQDDKEQSALQIPVKQEDDRK